MDGVIDRNRIPEMTSKVTYDDVKNKKNAFWNGGMFPISLYCVLSFLFSNRCFVLTTMILSNLIVYAKPNRSISFRHTVYRTTATFNTTIAIVNLKH